MCAAAFELCTRSRYGVLSCNIQSKDCDPGCLGKSIQRKLAPTHIRERKAIRVFHHKRVGRRSWLLQVHPRQPHFPCTAGSYGVQRNGLSGWISEPDGVGGGGCTPF